MKKIVLVFAAMLLALANFAMPAQADGDGSSDPTPCIVTEWEFKNEAPTGSVRSRTTKEWLADWCKDTAITHITQNQWHYDQGNGNFTMVFWDYFNGCDCWKSTARYWNMSY